MGKIFLLAKVLVKAFLSLTGVVCLLSLCWRAIDLFLSALAWVLTTRTRVRGLSQTVDWVWRRDGSQDKSRFLFSKEREMDIEPVCMSPLVHHPQNLPQGDNTFSFVSLVEFAFSWRTVSGLACITWEFCVPWKGPGNGVGEDVEFGFQDLLKSKHKVTVYPVTLKKLILMVAQEISLRWKGLH